MALNADLMLNNIYQSEEFLENTDHDKAIGDTHTMNDDENQGD